MKLIRTVLMMACGLPLLSGAPEPMSKSPAMLTPSSAALFAQENLLAWCIVPFDSRHRTPAERMAMLKRLGFSQYAWDWRQEHLKDLSEEIRLSRENGIRLRAIWLWIERDTDRVGHLGEGNRAVLDEVKKAGLAVEFWVGIHSNFETFPKLLPRKLPYLKAVNIDGMRPEGPKIMPLGQGTHELPMLQLLKKSGYTGPIGILGHVEDADVEDILRRNLEGLRKWTAGGEL
jgi:hypothetical protein